ncbi:GGDEF domain-containing protein [Reinekea sp.]|jgi:diguanylate cyclase (GGDEF)-like protein|uniref:GGDEF domain-containing protein n=1 Tax=Reinekea sp. TaxID=1970455 RepID=UPI002A817CBE|nr:GGDEF domain-containing protein [Reinekea sp.]
MMPGFFQNSTQPVAVFLENSALAVGQSPTETYDLKISLDPSAQHLPFEPFVSIIRFAARQADTDIEQLLLLPDLFTVLKPVLRAFILDQTLAQREPLNTDEVSYEQIEVQKALAYLLEHCFTQPVSIAVTHAQYLSPSALKLLQQEDYRFAGNIQLHLYLSTTAFTQLKNTQGFAQQIKRRHVTAANKAGLAIMSRQQQQVRLDDSRLWQHLNNAKALYCSDEILTLAERIHDDYEYAIEDKAAIISARMYAWMLTNDPERCHIHMQELQQINLADLGQQAVLANLTAICVGYLCLQDYPAASEAAQALRRYAQQQKLARERLLADFYIFFSVSMSGKLELDADQLKKLERALSNQGWPNLAAFVKCSLWFNETLMEQEPERLIGLCLSAIGDFERLHNLIGQSTAHHHISIVLGSTGRAKEAVSHIHKALNLTKQCGLSVRIHTTLNGLSFLLNGLGQTGPAREAIEAAYPLVLADGNFDQICTTLYNLALTAFYADHLQTTISLLDDIFSIMEYRNMSGTRFRTKEEMLAMQAIAAYLDGDRSLPLAIYQQLQQTQTRSHEGEAFILCIGLIAQDSDADAAEHFFITLSERFGRLRQNMHLELLALRLLVVYLRTIDERDRANTWAQQGIKQCRANQLQCCEGWFKPGRRQTLMQTTVEPRQAINLAQRQMGIDALKFENGLLHTLVAFSDSAIRSSTLEELLDAFLQNLQKFITIHRSTLELSLSDGQKLKRQIRKGPAGGQRVALKILTYPLHFIGGTGKLRVSFSNDLASQSHDARAIMQKICERLSRSVEFILDRLDSHRLAYHDTLTGAYNRAAFSEDIQRLLAPDCNHSLCLAFIDLDKFKLVNDTFGHLVGDEYLRTFSAELMSRIRATDHLYRLGGDEFLVCFQDLKLAETEAILNRFIDTFFHPDALQKIGVGTDLALGCSVGLVEFHPNANQALTEEQLIEQVDSLMYQAKRSQDRSIFSQVL